MSKFEQFLKDLEGASVLELNDLVKAIEEKFGVSVCGSSDFRSCNRWCKKRRRKNSFTVVLASAGEQKSVL